MSDERVRGKIIPLPDQGVDPRELAAALHDALLAEVETWPEVDRVFEEQRRLRERLTRGGWA